MPAWSAGEERTPGHHSPVKQTVAPAILGFAEAQGSSARPETLKKGKLTMI
jgi:hypothetical protein